MKAKKVLVLSSLEWTSGLWIYRFPNGRFGTLCRRVGRTEALRSIVRKNGCNAITIEGASWALSL